MKKRIKFILYLCLFANHFVFAESRNIKFLGQMPVTIKISSSYNHNAAIEKTILLQKIRLSQSAKNYLANQDLKNIIENTESPSASLPKQIQLEMNDVPVLDQGIHGTCVTFASTAAIDAAMQRGDYISQLCNLELGSYLASKNKFYPSGWDGSQGLIVLNQIEKYGVISKDYQHANGCSGIYTYPIDKPDIGKMMDTQAFTRHSENIAPLFVSWGVIFNLEDAFTAKTDSSKILAQIKTALEHGHRIIFSTLLDINGNYAPVAGALGSYKSSNDTWVLTKSISQDLARNEINAGHEMIITGYNDNVSVQAPDGSIQKGIFTLRNSWGKYAGDAGNFYMTYPYFKLLAMDAQTIKSGQSYSDSLIC